MLMNQDNQQTLALNVIKEAINLHRLFSKLLNIQSPLARASGMYYFNKFYQVTNTSPPDYALYAIASLYLATKVCEVPVSSNKFIREIVNAKSDVKKMFTNSFKTLDGVPPFSTPNFSEKLTKLFVEHEMKLIIALGFNFDMVLPYDLAIMYIAKILSWHIDKENKLYEELKSVLIRTCYIFINDLQYNEIFYIFPPEYIAISAIELTFSLLQVPLISPKSGPWFTFIVPSVDIDMSTQLTKNIHNFFSFAFGTINQKEKVQNIQTAIDAQLMVEWIRYPLIPMETVPICKPPSFDMLDSLVENDDSFKMCEADHAPKVSPPDFYDERCLFHNFLQIQSEYKEFCCLDKKDDSSVGVEEEEEEEEEESRESTENLECDIKVERNNEIRSGDWNSDILFGNDINQDNNLVCKKKIRA